MPINPICFEYEKLFGLSQSVGLEVIQDLMKKFGHANGEFIANDPGGRETAYRLGQASVIKHIIAQINIAKKNTEEK